MEEKQEVRQMLIDTDHLKKMLSCGIVTAKRIGNEANAKVVVGKRTLWNVKKIEDYIDKISE